MSIYIVKHNDNHHLFLLKDEYHHKFLEFWKNNRNVKFPTIDDTIKKGVRHSEIVEYKCEMPYYVASRYQSKVCVHGCPLWWYLDSSTMKCKIISQD